MYSCILCFNIQTVSMIAVTLIYNRSGWLGVKHQVTYLLLVCRCTLFHSILLLLRYIISSFIIFSLIGGGEGCVALTLLRLSVRQHRSGSWLSTQCMQGIVSQEFWSLRIRRRCQNTAMRQAPAEGGGGGVSRPVLTGLVTRNLLPAIKAVSVHGNS